MENLQHRTGIMPMKFYDKANETLSKLSINISREAYSKLEIYMRLLLEWNEKMNLTSIVNQDEIILKHFADSLLLLRFKEIAGENTIDVGCGAGFPGIPLKIAEGSIKLTLLDSLSKRLVFLETVIKELGLNNVELVHSRAEDGARNPGLRHSRTIVVSRAVARMNVLCEYCLPYVSTGGQFIAYKGFDCHEEIEEAYGAVSMLGGCISKIEKVSLDSGEYSRSLVFIDKIAETPENYPRNPKAIAKKPLC